MLTLTEAQWQTLQQREARQFVAAVCNEFMRSRPDSRELGRETVLMRMQSAYDYAARTGFTSTPHIVCLMYLGADAPGILDDPLVDGYLRKTGAKPEQRLDELEAVVDSKLRKEIC